MNIIIVDDEYLFREALKISVDFEKLGLEIVGEAKNGKEALSLIIEEEPDIALIDINMPIMDGLDLAKYVHDHGISTKLIIISGYDQFDYAKQAIHLGVHSYLLKPVDEQELEAELQDLMRSITVEQTVYEEIEDLKAQVKANKPYLKERLVLDILMGHHDKLEEDLSQKMSYLNINLPYDRFSVLVFDLCESRGCQSLDEEMREVYRLQVKKLVMTLLGNLIQYEWTYDYKERFCVILENTDHYSYERISAQLSSLVKVISESKEMKLYVGISNSYKGIAYSNTAYKEAIAASQYGVSQEEAISFYGNFANKGLSLVLISKEQRNDLLINMRMGNSQEVLKSIDDLFSKIQNNHLHPNHLRYVFMELTSLCMELFSEYDHSEEVFDRLLKDLYEEGLYQQPLGQLQVWFKDSVIDIMAKIQENKSSKSLELVQEIKHYVDDHFSRSDFSIEDISKTLYVNYSHLCYTFKKETNRTINDYLIEKRLSNAIQLMDDGHTVIRNISEAVGFSDSGYFSKSFKKHMGLTPSQYMSNKI